MSRSSFARSADRLGLAAGLLGAIVVLATLTGGASFADTLGQAVVRTGAMLLTAVAIAAGLRFDFKAYRGPALLLAAAAALVAIQLVPLPPGMWRTLPGRSAFDLSGVLPELAATWRPAAIVPDAGWNALFALVVPASALLLVMATPRAQLAASVPLLIAMVALSSAVAALQFAGSGVDNPFINERLGFASGLLANRNHQALFLAIGIAAAMQWGAVRPFVQARAVIAGATSGWFVLMILATGSRSGLLLGLVALVGGAALIMGPVRRAGKRIAPRAAMIAGVSVLLGLAAIVAISLYAGRSESITRLSQAVVGEDMRVRALPVVLDMVRAFWPLGAGQGGFATLFRAMEPDALLKPTYFNRAHNDYLELLIEAGVLGAAVLVAALAWFARRAWRAWRQSPDGETQRARLGTIVIVLILLASVADYPARTPLMMTILVLTIGWLGPRSPSRVPPLPTNGSPL